MIMSLFGLFCHVQPNKACRGKCEWLEPSACNARVMTCLAAAGVKIEQTCQQVVVKTAKLLSSIDPRQLRAAIGCSLMILIAPLKCASPNPDTPFPDSGNMPGLRSDMVLHALAASVFLT